MSCASNMPVRDFTVDLYLIDWENRCLETKAGKICEDKPDVIGITPEDYARERNYQDELIKACQ